MRLFYLALPGLYPLVSSDVVSKLSLSSVSCPSTLVKPKEGIVGTLGLTASGSEAQAIGL